MCGGPRGGREERGLGGVMSRLIHTLRQAFDLHRYTKTCLGGTGGMEFNLANAGVKVLSMVNSVRFKVRDPVDGT